MRGMRRQKERLLYNIPTTMGKLNQQIIKRIHANKKEKKRIKEKDLYQKGEIKIMPRRKI
ncbi:6301_t:CDS:2 [Entrophospora sp. SA101]|nr:6301_t:CDS:2 [Entrophospora sp. SA101]